MSSEEILLAIKESELADLVIDFITISDNVSQIFDKIDQKYATLDEYLKCESKKIVDKKYESIKSQFTIIKDNIISYSDDMAILLKKMNQGHKDLTNLTNAEKEIITNKTKEVK